MHYKLIAHTTMALSLGVVLGCQESRPIDSGIVERVASPKPTLTSTAAPTSPHRQEHPRIDPQPVAADKESAIPFAPSLDARDGLELERLVMTSEIEDREPTSPSSVFGTGLGKVYAFIEASNSSSRERSLLVHFISPAGEVSGGVELRVPASTPRWRTWAYTRHAKALGIWRVEVRDGEGALLGALPFEVQPDC